MNHLFLFVYLICGPITFLFADPQPDILVYDQGTTQITSEFDAYQNMVEGVPLTGTVFVTHDIKDAVDNDSFRLGDKPLKVEFVRSVSMSSYGGNLELSIYSFKIDGLKKGEQTLPPVIVKVGGKDFQAPPMYVELNPAS